MNDQTQKNAKKSPIRSGSSRIVVSIHWTDDAELKARNKTRIQKRYRFASGRDPFTLPHTKTDCSHVCHNDIPPFDYCCEYTTYYQWMYVDWFLVVQLATPREIESEVQGCLQEGAIVGLIAAVIAAYSGGGGAALEAAKDAFIASFLECLRKKITDGSIISAWVQDPPESHWGDWETH